MARSAFQVLGPEYWWGKKFVPARVLVIDLADRTQADNAGATQSVRRSFVSHSPSRHYRLICAQDITTGGPDGGCAPYNSRIHPGRSVHFAACRTAGIGAVMADAVSQVHPDPRAGQRSRHWR